MTISNFKTTKKTNVLRQRVDELQAFIGNTPLFPIKNIFRKNGVKIFAKLEWQQMGASVKARPAYNIIKKAIYNNQIDKSKGILDATSGNTGIAYASIGAALSIPVSLCLPENASEERKQILQALGVNIIYTSRFGGTDEAQEKAQELAQQTPEAYYYANQYANEANWQAHYHTTAPEILEQTNGDITHFVAGLGTTGTFVGTSRGLMALKRKIVLTSLSPDIAMHGLEGWKHLPTAKVPEIYDPNIAHQQLKVATESAYAMIKQVAQYEGLLISPSAAANLVGAIEVAKQIKQGVIVTVFPDNANKYSEVLNHIFK